MILPESFLRCLSAEDRKSLGKGGLTAEEALAKAEVKNERQLQTMIVNLLRLKGINPLWHRTDKKSAATIGWPDITFCIGWEPPYGRCEVNACAWEIKHGKGALSVEQARLHVQLSTPPNCWRVRIIRSIDEALAELKELGI